MRTISKADEAQIASDKIADLADDVSALAERLDRMCREIGDDYFHRVEAAWSGIININPDLSKRLHQIAREIAPPSV